MISLSTAPLVAMLLAAPAAQQETTASAPPSATVEEKTMFVSVSPTIYAILWKSEDSSRDCQKAIREASVTDWRLLRPKIGQRYSPQPPACQEATLANLARGTEVRTLADTGACGSLKAVVVTSGRHEGKEGCLDPAHLSDETPQP